MTVEILKFIVIFFACPFLIGSIFFKKSEIKMCSKIERLSYCHVIGFIVMLAVFELLCVPMCILKIKLHVLIIVYTIWVVVTCIVSISIIVKQKHFFNSYNMIKLNRSDFIFLIVALVIICLQLFFSVYYQSNWMSGDDYEYVTRTSTSLYTDRIVSYGAENIYIDINAKRSFCSWEIFVAWLCKLTGINVPTMVHTILNVSLIIIAFMVFYLMGCSLFETVTERLIFILTIAFVNLFGLYSHYSLTFRILMTMWQGKAVFMAIVFQFLFVFVISTGKSEFSIKNMIIYIFLSLASCALTPTGVGMFVGAMIIFSILNFIIKSRFMYFRYFVASIIFPLFFLIAYMYYR